jgi:Fe-S oxidoreductase
MDQLQKYQFDKIFPGCRLLDIHEYLFEKGIKLDGVQGTRLLHPSLMNSSDTESQASAPPAPALCDAVSVRYMYHDPCHSPMKTYQPLKVVKELMGTDVPLNERCCGESGTFGVTLPHIATQVRFRKEEEMRKGADELRSDGFNGEVKVLTSCPSCQQGLSRYNDDSGTTPEYIVVEMARHLLGKDWLSDYVNKANNGGIERVLL